MNIIPETCGTCRGDHRVPTIDQYSERCPTCLGKGTVYPAETVERIARVIADGFNGRFFPAVPLDRDVAVAVLDALNEP